MADPISILGAFAATTQLTAYTFRVIAGFSDFRRHIRDPSAMIDPVLDEVECFLDVAENMRCERRQLTQDSRLDYLLSDCTRPAKALQHLLQKIDKAENKSKAFRVLKLIKYQQKSREIESLLHAIERAKSTLVLYRCLQHNSVTRFDRPTVTIASPGSWMVLLPRNSQFIDRDSVVDSIQEKLERPSMMRSVALIGPKGSGKSQIALEYAYRFKQQSPARSVFWINADNQVVFEQSFLRIRWYTHPIPSMRFRDIQMNDVTAYLKSEISGEWLLILDSVDVRNFNDCNLLNRAIPKTKNGSVIITSCNNFTASDIWNAEGTIILNTWSSPDAKRLLELQIGATDAEDTSAVADLLSELRYLPLLIVQAASYMRKNSCSISRYLRLLRSQISHRIKILCEPDTQYLDTTSCRVPFLHLILAVQAISDQYVVAKELLFVMACMNSTWIHRDLLQMSYHGSQISTAITILKEYSLIISDQSGQLVSTHSLVHLSIRAYLRAQELFDTYSRQAFLLISEHFVLDTKPEVISFDHHQLLPHAISAWQSYMGQAMENSASRIETEVSERLASNVSWHLKSTGNCSAARNFAEEAMRYSLLTYGPQSPRFLTCLRDLVIIERELGNIEKVAELLSTIVEAGDAFCSSSDSQTIGLQGEVGLSLRNQGRYQEAVNWHWKAVALSERHFGHEHAATLEQVHQYALSQYKNGNLGYARDCFEQILSSRKKRFGLHHAGTLDALDHLAVVLQAQGDWDIAGSYHRQALEVRVIALGPDHPDVFHSKANVAEIYRRDGNLALAKKSTEEALNFFQTVHGLDHPTTLIALGIFGILHQCQKNYSDAERVTKEVVYRREWKLGPHHPDVLLSMFDLSVLLQCQSKHREALDVEEKVLAVRRRVLPKDHSDRRASETHVSQLQQNIESSLL